MRVDFRKLDFYLVENKYYIYISFKNSFKKGQLLNCYKDNEVVM